MLCINCAEKIRMQRGCCMPVEYSFETRERAEELYIVEGLTFAQVSEATGVSVSQLQRWGQEGKLVRCKTEIAACVFGHQTPHRAAPAGAGYPGV